MTDRLEALVVGGSLAGLTSALAMARVGIRVRVVERVTKRRSGAALAAQPTALREVIGPEVAETVLKRLSGGGRYLRGSQPVAWQDLREALAKAVEEHPLTTLISGVRVEEVGEDSDGAWALTDDGSHLRADILIGADGHRSCVRRYVAPENPDAEFAGYLLWVGVAEEGDLDLRGSWPNGLDIQSSGGYILLGYPLPARDGSVEPGRRRLGWAWYDPRRNGLLVAQGAVADGVVRHSIHPSDVPEKIYAELPARARRMWPSPWAEAIADSARRREITATPIAEYVPGRLSRGRVAIVGNAAHVPTPMTGSGFAASLEDAESLSRALDGVLAGGVESALGKYERDRLEEARDLVLSGQSFSRAFASGW